MVDSIKSVRDELHIFQSVLNNDKDEFMNKLNEIRNNIFTHIKRQMENLMKIKNKFSIELNYVEEQNIDTCNTNQREFDRICLLINQNGIKAFDLLNQFKKTFPFRPRMLKDIPSYDFKDINFDDFIKNKREQIDHSFIPIENSSIGHSHHKQFAEQNKEPDCEPQSRLISTCSSIAEPDRRIDVLFQIPYENNRTPRLISFNDDENSFLIYLLQSHELEHISNETRKIIKINLPFTEPILNLGYSKFNHLFYFSTRQTNRFVFFRLNNQQIDIIKEINLINQNDHFISVHIYENMIRFLFLSFSKVILGKYDIENSLFLPMINLENKLLNPEEKIKYHVIDFTINDSFISFLVQTNPGKRWMIVVYDTEYLERIHSFDLIDARYPLSIISTEKKSILSSKTSNESITTTMCNDNIEYSLLFINDPKAHLIHCCNYQQYQTSIQINAFGICALNDGNLSLIASRDIRGLKVQDYLKQHNIELFSSYD